MPTSHPTDVSPPPQTFLLRPHRSLSPAGFMVFMLGVGGVSFATGLLFYSIGAWPVVGFLGLDVALIYLAFRANYRAGERQEIVRLADHVLEVAQVSARGRRQTVQLSTAWLRIELAELAGGVSRLCVRSGGQVVEIGAFLSDPERRDLAAALRAALAEQRGLRP